MPTILFMFSFFNGATAVGGTITYRWNLSGDYPCIGVEA